MNSNLSNDDFNQVDLTEAVKLEKQINEFRDSLRENNLSMLGTEGYYVRSAMIYNNVFSNLEKIGDHIMNVNESIVGEI